MKRTTTAVLVLAVLGSGCGDVLDDVLPSKGSCTVPSPQACTDYTGDAWSAPGSGSRACAQVGNGATFSSSACPTAGRVGSCVVEGGAASEVVLRFYPPSTTATAQAVCGRQAGSRFSAD